MSKLFSLNWYDLANGLFTAIVGAIIIALYQIVQTGTIPTMDNAEAIAIIGANAGLAYIVKRYFSNSTGDLLTK